MQDPNQLTKHGKSKVAPIVYTLNPPHNTGSSPDPTATKLRVSAQRRAESGSGTYQTLAPVSVARIRSSKRSTMYKRKVLDAYIRDLQLGASLALVRPSSGESTLIARWVDMLGTAPANNRPLSILGTWIQSIPSRVGANSMLDLAIEFLIDSHAVYWDDSYSKRQAASTTKLKALRELQLAVSQTQTRKTYDMVLATKMHYAAEVRHTMCEISELSANLLQTLLGVDTMYHAIHAFGLAELLKVGGVSNVDDEHYWDLIDNTYIDDVSVLGYISFYCLTTLGQRSDACWKSIGVRQRLLPLDHVPASTSYRLCANHPSSTSVYLYHACFCAMPTFELPGSSCDHAS